MDAMSYAKKRGQHGDFAVLTKFLGISESELMAMVEKQVAEEFAEGRRPPPAESLRRLKAMTQKSRPVLRLVSSSDF